MICNISIFGNITFLVTIYDGHQYIAKGVLKKWGRIVFKIVSPTDDFETIKNGITLIVK